MFNHLALSKDCLTISPFPPIKRHGHIGGSMATIQVPKEYGYVFVVAAGPYALSIWLGARIGSFRRAAKIPHPIAYASVETIANASSAEVKRALYLFNCAQRAHHNVLENYPAALTGMLISGLRYPTLAAAAGALWTFGRVIYATGYTSPSEKNVNGRGRFYRGGFHLAALCQVGFLVLVSKIGVDLLIA